MQARQNAIRLREKNYLSLGSLAVSLGPGENESLFLDPKSGQGSTGSRLGPPTLATATANTERGPIFGRFLGGVDSPRWPKL